MNVDMNERSSQSFIVYYTIKEELKRSYKLLHVHSCLQMFNTEALL
jgi:hypothetical protein